MYLEGVMNNTSKSGSAMRSFEILGALASIAGLGATLVAPTVGWIIIAGGLALLGWSVSSRLVSRLRRERASRILMVTPKVDELDIWRSTHDRDGATDLIRVAFSKPRFAFLVVRNKGSKHLDHVIKHATFAGSRELRLGQWAEEYTGEFVPHSPDGISLKVGAERLLLLGVAFPEQKEKRWFRVESGLPKKYYTGYDSAIFNSDRELGENPATIKIRFQEEGVDLPVEITVGFDGKGAPCLIDTK